MAYEEVNPNIWRPEREGELIEGVLTNVQQDVGANESKLYTIESALGITNVWGSTVLDSRMAVVKVGDKVRITYQGLGIKKGGKNPPKMFKVEIDRAH